MRSLLRDHFDKILLAGVVMYLVHVVIFLANMNVDPATISWARELTSGFAGGLLGLITGVRIGQKMEQDKQERATVPPPATPTDPTEEPK